MDAEGAARVAGALGHAHRRIGGDPPSRVRGDDGASCGDVPVAGSAGQRIRSGAALLGTAALASGLYATQKDDYPITVRTGHSVSEILLSPEEILYTEIESPDVLLLLSEDGLGQVGGRFGSIAEGGRILADENVAFEHPAGVTVKTFPFRRRASRLGKASPSVVALATLVRLTAVVPPEALLDAALAHENPKIAEANRKAVEAGFDLAG